jgi:hypothetical protein
MAVNFISKRYCMGRILDTGISHDSFEVRFNKLGPTWSVGKLISARRLTEVEDCRMEN